MHYLCVSYVDIIKIIIEKSEKKLKSTSFFIHLTTTSNQYDIYQPTECY